MTELCCLNQDNRPLCMHKGIEFPDIGCRAVAMERSDKSDDPVPLRVYTCYFLCLRR